MRLKYIDALRGFTMFLVVFWHVMANSFGLGDSSLGAFFKLFRMPMFFFISGYIGYKAIDKLNTWKGYISLLKKKAFVQLVPTAIIFSLFKFVHGSSPLVFFDKGLTGYWFTLSLFELFFIYYTISFVCSIDKGSKLVDFLFVFLICTTWLAGIYIHHLQDEAPKFCVVFSVGNTLCNMPFFLTGLLFRKHQDRLLNIVTSQYVFSLFVVLFVVGFFLTQNVFTKDFNLPLFYLLRSFILPFFGIFSVFTVFYLSREFFDKNGTISRIMQFVGRRTLDIYLIHYFFIIDLSKYKSFFLLEGGGEFIVGEIVIFGLSAIAIISLCLLISGCLRKSPLLAKYLFGILPKSK